jgi:hypothetical protein
LNDEIEEGECVLNFYHASTHLHNAMEIIYGKNHVGAIVAHKKYRHILRYDNKVFDQSESYTLLVLCSFELVLSEVIYSNSEFRP